MLKGLSSEEFEKFLRKLDDDQHQAAEKYLALRERLERFFEWRGCDHPEDLTDIVFDRLIKKIIEGEEIKNAEAFAVTIAKYVLMENRRTVLKNEELDENSRQISSDSEETDGDDEDEIKRLRLRCLDECLAKLPEEKRKLMIGYFDTDEKTMIKTRKSLAENIGINLNSLRIRISRLKTKLEKCTKKCCTES
jgi:RNA polymerase sigma factor (sigma-70 family)